MNRPSYLPDDPIGQGTELNCLVSVRPTVLSARFEAPRVSKLLMGTASAATLVHRLYHKPAPRRPFRPCRNKYPPHPFHHTEPPSFMSSPDVTDRVKRGVLAPTPCLTPTYPKLPCWLFPCVLIQRFNLLGANQSLFRLHAKPTILPRQL